MKHSELTGIASQAEVNEAIQQLFKDKTSVILLQIWHHEAQRIFQY